jgi:hypothetical protein
MSTYNCRCVYFRSSVPVYHTTESYTSEKEVVNEVIDYLTLTAPHPEPFLIADYFMEVEERSGAMTQQEYNVYIKSVVNTFNALLEWCDKYDKYHDFNNFENGWSVSMSVYS